MFKLEWMDGVSQIYSYMVSGRRTYNYDVRDSLGGKWLMKGGNKPKEPFSLRDITIMTQLGAILFKLMNSQLKIKRLFVHRLKLLLTEARQHHLLQYQLPSSLFEPCASNLLIMHRRMPFLKRSIPCITIFASVLVLHLLQDVRCVVALSDISNTCTIHLPSPPATTADTSDPVTGLTRWFLLPSPC